MASSGSGGNRLAPIGLAVATGTALTTAVAMAVTGTLSPSAHLPHAAAAELPAFDSCAQLAGWYRDIALEQVTPYGLPGERGNLYDGVVPLALPARSGGTSGEVLSSGAVAGAATAAGGSAVPAPKALDRVAGAVTNGPTGTNVQAAGVDEPDLAKVDGDRVVGVAGRRLYVSTLRGDALSTPSSVELPLAYATELLVDGDRALVVGVPAAVEKQGQGSGSPSVGSGPASGGGSAGAAGSTAVAPNTAVVAPDVPAVAPDMRVIGPAVLLPYPPAAGVALVLVDLRSEAPTVLGSEEIDGRYLSARLTGDTARVVVSSVKSPDMVGPASPGAEQSALQANQAAIRDATAQDWLPTRELRDAGGAVVAKGPLLDCADVRHPVDASGLGTLSVVTVQLDGDQPLDSDGTVGVSAAGDLVYASTDRLYVATSRWGHERGLVRGAAVTTQIHAFDASHAGTTSYLASGSVPGFLYGRWAMDEHDGLLRVATTSAPAVGGPEPMPMPVDGDGGPVSGTAKAAGGAPPVSQSSVVVLKEEGATLVEVGRLDGLGPTEQVRAVRWLGDLAAVVTFRRTDPLYLIDLSGPTPRTAGTLKVDGYSAYLHPVGDGLLLGIGHDADAQGRVGEAMVQLFDVRVPAKPVRTARLTVGQANLLAEQDSRAFTYTSDGRAVLPIQRWAGRGPQAGALSVTLDAAKRTLTMGPQFAAGMDDQTLRVLPVNGRLVAVGTSALTLLGDHMQPVTRVAVPR